MLRPLAPELRCGRVRPGPQVSLLAVDCVVDEGGSRSKHPKTGSRSGGHRPGPEVAMDTRVVMEGNEDVILCDSAPRVQLGVYGADRSEQCESLINEVGAEVEQQTPTFFGSSRFSPRRP